MYKSFFLLLIICSQVNGNIFDNAYIQYWSNTEPPIYLFDSLYDDEKQIFDNNGPGSKHFVEWLVLSPIDPIYTISFVLDTEYTISQLNLYINDHFLEQIDFTNPYDGTCSFSGCVNNIGGIPILELWPDFILPSIKFKIEIFQAGLNPPIIREIMANGIQKPYVFPEANPIVLAVLVLIIYVIFYREEK